MRLKLTLWAIGLSLAAVSIWGGVNHYRNQARLAREAQLQAERAEREAARAKAYIELRSPDEIAAEQARAAAEKANREAHERAQAKFDALQAASAKAEEAKREQALKLAIAGAITLKQSMKDPDSFKLNSLLVMTTGALCYRYRAKNSFAAIVPGRALVHPEGRIYVEERMDRDGFWLLWKAHCDLGTGQEVADALKRSGAI